MKESKLLPAISREVEFIAHHADEADAICDNQIKVDPFLKKSTDRTYDRANQDVLDLLNDLTGSLNKVLPRPVRIKWRHIAPGDWKTWGPIYIGPSDRADIGSSGLFLQWKPELKLICWACPRGGLDARKKLIRALEKKLETIYLASENPKRYPGWSRSDDGIVWFDRKLTIRTSQEGLRNEVMESAKRFFAFAKPLLGKLAK